MRTNHTDPQRLYLMQVATIPEWKLSYACYLVQTSDRANILIDSGLPAHGSPPPGVPMPLMGRNVIEQLEQIGLQPGDIDLLVCTHFDPDHSATMPPSPTLN